MSEDGYSVKVSFRNAEVAAPLKRHGLQVVSYRADAFRNAEVAAPLKLMRVWIPPLPGHAFRNAEVVAPLKRRVPAEGRPDAAPSATLKLRPH